MIDPTPQQEAEGIRPRAIWAVGIGVVAVSAVLVAIAWWLVVPPSALEPAARASTLEHGLIEHASGGADLHTAGEQALERTQWVDRKAGVVRIPIERAIDAVVANPRLIAAHPAAISGTGSVLRAPSPVANPPASSARPGVARAADPHPTPGEVAQ